MKPGSSPNAIDYLSYSAAYGVSAERNRDARCAPGRMPGGRRESFSPVQTRNASASCRQLSFRVAAPAHAPPRRRESLGACMWLASRHFDLWAWTHGIPIDFIRPGRPVHHAPIESSNDRVRDECLSAHWFESFGYAGHVLDEWRTDYNEVRPRSNPGDRTPKELAAGLRGHGCEGAIA